MVQQGQVFQLTARGSDGERQWIALEQRHVDHEERVVYVRRSFTRGELKIPKTEASTRAVPLQARALDALDRIKDGNGSLLLFPPLAGAEDSGHLAASACLRSPGTRSRPLRFVPASQHSISRVTWAPA
jgi:hypothetical protein